MANLQEAISIEMQTTEIATSNVVSAQADSFTSAVLASILYADFQSTGIAGAMGAVTLPLPSPNNQALGVYIKNMGTGNQTLNITLTWNGLSAVQVCTLAAGGVILIFNPTSATATQIISIVVESASANVNFSYKIIG